MSRSVLFALAISLPAVSGWAQSAQPPESASTSLEQRLDTARAARTLREAYFGADGEPPLTIDQAFSHLAGAPLADPSFLQARESWLDARRRERARERLESGGTSRAEAVARACDAQDATDALEARLISSLLVGLEVAPGFTASSIEIARRPWREVRERANGLAEDDPELDDARREALNAAEAERLLLLYQSNALRKMTIAEDLGLIRLVEAELSESRGERLDAAAQDRLGRAAPLLGSELSILVEAALGNAAATSSVGVALPETSAGNTTTELDEAEASRREANFEKRRELESRTATLEAESAQAQALGILDDTRARRLRDAARASNVLVRTIRDAIAQQVAVHTAQSTEDRENRAGPSEVDTSTEEFLAALEEREAATARELDALLDLEKRALALRRQLESFDAPVTRQLFFEELLEELRQAPLWLQLDWHNFSRWLRSLPTRATDVNAVGALIEVSLDLLVLVFVWIYLRNQTPRWLNRAIASFRKKDTAAYSFRRGTLPATERELSIIARYATDAIVARILYGLLLPRSELLALIALVWGGWALLKGIPPALRLVLPLVGRALDPLETDNELPAEVRTLGEKTASWFLWWWIVFTITSFVAVPLLQADRLARVVQVLGWVSLLVLLVFVFARWSSWTRQFIANLADQSAISRWLARPVRSRIGAVIRSAFGSLYIVLRLVFWALVDRGWLSRSGTSIALSQLNLASAEAELLDPEARERIRASNGRLIERTHELELVQNAFESWRRERRRGIVAVIGDHGMGKSVFLEQALAALTTAAPDVPVTKLALPVQKRTSGLRERLEWLTKPLKLTVPKNATRDTFEKFIVEHLESLPPQVFLVDDLHFLLRRTVGGFDTLEVARNIIQACADEHFWVLTLHRPAWIYIDGVSTAMRLAFRERIELPALEADELGELLVETARAAGFEPEFRNLLRGRRPYADGESLDHKARKLYWRIVSQASRGNPRVVVDFWLSSLGATRDPENGEALQPVPVYLFSGHNDEEVVGLSDEYLFLLTALVVHDGLKVEDLSEVLNVALARVRVACQHLESLGIIGESKRRYLVTPSWQPTVARVLNRRSFSRQ